MKFKIINNYQKLNFNSLKKVVKTNCNIKPSYLARIRQKAFLTNIIETHNYNNTVIYIQSLIRRKLSQNKLSDMKSQLLLPKKTYHNHTNLLCDDFFNNEIPSVYIFTYDNYLFDLRELYRQSNTTLINPYTNITFPKNIQRQIQRLFLNCKKQNIPLESIDNEIPNEMRISVWFNNFYSRLGELHCYTNIESFNNKNLNELSIFINNLFNRKVFRRIFYKKYNGLEKYNLYYTKLYTAFQNIPVNYDFKYIINNYYRNPYLNFLDLNNNINLSESQSQSEPTIINNKYEISVDEHYKFQTRDKILIENYLEMIFNILQDVLQTSDDAHTMALIINSAISDDANY
jgi:hypothetical protein